MTCPRCGGSMTVAVGGWVAMCNTFCGMKEDA